MKEMMALALVLNFSSVFAAGWTVSAPIVATNIQQEDPVGNGVASNKFSITLGPVPGAIHPSNCATDPLDKNQNFLMDLDSEKQQKIFAMLVAAQLHDKNVRLHTTDFCPIWGAPIIDGVEIESK